MRNSTSSKISTSRKHTNHRQGAIAVLALFVLSIFIVVAAFSVELGMFMAEKAEMQRSADSAALAACWEYTAHRNQDVEEEFARDYARLVASDMAGTNLVRLRSLTADQNTENRPEGDIVFGQYEQFGDPYGNMVDLPIGTTANAVTVRLRQTEQRNGEVTFTLGRLLGIDSKPLEVQAVAAVAKNVRGFYAPEDSGTLNILPFAVKKPLWDSLFNGGADDNFTYDFDTGSIRSGADGVPEINIYPHSTGVSGNSGTVDIGSSGNSTNDIKRQILHGVSKSDLAHHGGKLELGPDNTLVLNGDTGISSGMKAQLQQILGEPRVIMVYSKVQGNGNNAMFTIIQFVGIRIMEINFKGSKNKSKKVIIQPTGVIAEYAIVSNENNEPSQFVYAPPVIVR